MCIHTVVCKYRRSKYLLRHADCTQGSVKQTQTVSLNPSAPDCWHIEPAAHIILYTHSSRAPVLICRAHRCVCMCTHSSVCATCVCVCIYIAYSEERLKPHTNRHTHTPDVIAHNSLVYNKRNSLERDNRFSSAIGCY